MYERTSHPSNINIGPHRSLLLIHLKWLQVHQGPLQALSLVEKVEPAQVCFTLHSRDQHSM